jgi:phage terminase Nu1 subunit (DNA packaging protein)
MSDQQLKDLLTRLHKELENTDKVDSETLELVRELDSEINRLVDSDSDSNEFENVMDRAKSVETRFAVDHPAAERFLREIIDALAKVGI